MKIYWDSDLVPGDFLEFLEQYGYTSPQTCVCECGMSEEDVFPWVTVHAGGLWVNYEWSCCACDSQNCEGCDTTEIYAKYGIQQMEKL